MKILDKYLIRHFLFPFIYCLITFFIISIIYDLSINLETFIQKKVEFNVIFSYYSMLLPIMVVNTMPIATLMAILYEFGNLQRFSEVVGMRSCGVSNLRIIMPLLICGILISVLSFTIGELFVPHSLYKIHNIEKERFKKENEEEDNNRVIAFYNRESRRSWVGNYNPLTDKMTNFEVRLFDKKGKLTEKVSAEEILYENNGWYFIGSKIHDYRNSFGEADHKKDIKKTIAILDETPTDLINSLKETMFMNLFELYDHIKILPQESKICTEEKVDLYNKIAAPFVNIIVMIIGLAFGLRATKGGLLIGVGTCIGIFVAYYGISIVTLAMGKQGIMPAWLGAWFPNISFFILGLVLMRKVN